MVNCKSYCQLHQSINTMVGASEAHTMWSTEGLLVDGLLDVVMVRGTAFAEESELLISMVALWEDDGSMSESQLIESWGGAIRGAISAATCKLRLCPRFLLVLPPPPPLLVLWGSSETIGADVLGNWRLLGPWERVSSKSDTTKREEEAVEL